MPFLYIAMAGLTPFHSFPKEKKKELKNDIIRSALDQERVKLPQRALHGRAVCSSICAACNLEEQSKPTMDRISKWERIY